MFKNLIDRKGKFEGFVPGFYYDSQGYLTGLKGHNFENNHIPEAIVKEFGYDWVKSPPYSEEIADAFLHEDTIKSLKDVMAVFGKDSFGVDASNRKVHLREMPYEVLTVMDDMMFNMGMTRFLGFKKMIQYIRDGKYWNAAREIKWSDGQKQDKFSVYYAQINSVVAALEDRGGKNTFHRAEENIGLLLEAAK